LRTFLEKRGAVMTIVDTGSGRVGFVIYSYVTERLKPTLSSCGRRCTIILLLLFFLFL
jgi:hypothetical protein